MHFAFYVSLFFSIRSFCFCSQMNSQFSSWCVVLKWYLFQRLVVLVYFWGWCGKVLALTGKAVELKIPLQGLSSSRRFDSNLNVQMIFLNTQCTLSTMALAWGFLTVIGFAWLHSLLYFSESLGQWHFTTSIKGDLRFIDNHSCSTVFVTVRDFISALY